MWKLFKRPQLEEEEGEKMKQTWWGIAEGKAGEYVNKRVIISIKIKEQIIWELFKS